MPSRLARWWGGWRVALRLARRDSWRGKGRALLVVLLIALPVATVTGVIVYAAAEQADRGPARQALLSLGSEADARVLLGAGQAVQTPSLTTRDPVRRDPDHRSTPSRRRCPPGSRTVSIGTAASVVVESGPWGVQSAVSVQDVRDPLNAGRWTRERGAAPASASEVALSVQDLRRLQAGIGSTVTLTTTVRSRARRGRSPSSGRSTGRPRAAAWCFPASAGRPGTCRTPPSCSSTRPRPLTWTDVRRLNAVGAVVAAAGFSRIPPPFCDPDRLCLDSGPAPDDPGSDAPSDLQIAEAARVAALGAVALVLVVLQVALLAGPAFAVQLRRRQRELGLVGASGGDAAALRRTVLASGVVLGVVGAALGVALGWAAVWLVGVPLASVPLVQDGRMPQGVPPLPWYVAGGRAGRRRQRHDRGADPGGDGRPRRRRRHPARAASAASGADRGRRCSACCSASSASRCCSTAAARRLLDDPLILGVGLIAGELGLVLVMPWLVVQLGRVGRFLPLTPRLAVRDAGRHRLRTAAAACAIAAAAAAAVATSTWATSQRLQVDSFGIPYVAGLVAGLVLTLVRRHGRQRLRGAGAPRRRGGGTRLGQVTLLNVGLRSQDPKAVAVGYYGSLDCAQPDGPAPPTTADGAGQLQPCGLRPASAPGVRRPDLQPRVLLAGGDDRGPRLVGTAARSAGEHRRRGGDPQSRGAVAADPRLARPPGPRLAPDPA